MTACCDIAPAICCWPGLRVGVLLPTSMLPLPTTVILCWIGEATTRRPPRKVAAVSIGSIAPVLRFTVSCLPQCILPPEKGLRTRDAADLRAHSMICGQPICPALIQSGSPMSHFRQQCQSMIAAVPDVDSRHDAWALPPLKLLELFRRMFRRAGDTKQFSGATKPFSAWSADIRKQLMVIRPPTNTAGQPAGPGDSQMRTISFILAFAFVLAGPSMAGSVRTAVCRASAPSPIAARRSCRQLPGRSSLLPVEPPVR